MNGNFLKQIILIILVSCTCSLNVFAENIDNTIEEIEIK